MKKDNEYKSFLDEGYDYSVEKPSEKTGNKKKSSVISRQTKLIIVLAAFLAVVIPIYIFVLIPKLSTEDPQTNSNTLEPHNGEVLLQGGSIGMMPMLSENDIDRVDIKNKVPVKEDGSVVDKYEEWAMFFDSKSKLWGIENYTGISYDTSSLITILGYFTQMKVQDRIEFNSVDEITMSAYGFDEASMPTKYTVTTRDGKKYTVTMGNQIPTATGYYAYYTDAEGKMRPTVYIISNYYASLINGSVYSLMAPTITQLLDQRDYVPKKFAIYKGLEPYFEIKKLEGDALNETAKTSHLYTKINGVIHEYDASADYSNLLYEVLQKGITGSKVVYAKPDSLEDMPEDILLKYGIDKKNPYRQLLFEAKTMFASNESHMAEQWVMFSEKTTNVSDNEIYYAWNVAYNIIVEVRAEAVEFIEHNLSFYYESYIFLTPFYSVDSITIDSTKLPAEYVSSGLSALKETFKLKVDTVNKLLDDVIVESLGTSPISPTKKITGLKNFSNYYKVLLSISTQVEVPEDIISKIDLTKPHITITVKTLGGNTRVLNFYLYNSRHAYYTLDGLGVSYVRYTDLVRLLNATENLIEGKVVTTEYSTDDPNVDVPQTEPKPNGISSTEIILIVVLVAVILVGGAIAAFVLIKSKKNDPEKKTATAKKSETNNKNKKK
ncbi:MAG: DUF4340 domain-containing protein [Ruminococcaceae bacterium]|nr:DUF4340 domain-containing protein [Oscillospiraceae bacterium]